MRRLEGERDDARMEVRQLKSECNSLQTRLKVHTHTYIHTHIHTYVHTYILGVHVLYNVPYRQLEKVNKVM